MPYCSDCGAAIPEGGKFCTTCGKPTDTIVAPKTTYQNTNTISTFTFKRMHSPYAQLVKTKIFADGKLYGSIKENEELVITLPTGSHTFELKTSSNPATVVTLSTSGVKPSVYYPFKLNISCKAIQCSDNEKASKKSNKMGCLLGAFILSMLVIFLVIVIAILGGDNSTDSSKLSTTTNNSIETTSEYITSFQPVSGEIGNWRFAVTDFYYTKSVSVGLLHEYSAKDGDQYCIINLSVKNIGKEMDTFLPYVTWNDDVKVKIRWKDYEYTRSELFWADDHISSETINPLVTVTGNIAFELPNEIINSDTSPVLVFILGNSEIKIPLEKK